MRNRVVASLLVVAILIGAGAGYLAGNANEHTITSVTMTTSTSTSTITFTLSPTTSTTTSSSAGSTTTTTQLPVGEGIELMATVNSSAISPNATLRVTVSLYNNLPSVVHIPSSNNWKVNGFPIAMWPGCFLTQPVEFMILKGSYSLGSLEAASTNSSVPLGNCYGGHGNVESLAFWPTSNTANLSGTSCPGSGGCSTNWPSAYTTYNLTSTFNVNGYWAYPINGSEAQDVFTEPNPPCYVNGQPDCIGYNYPEVGPIAQHFFTEGVYTLVASDEWGQTVILHFSTT